MLNGRNFLLRLLSKNVYSPFREFDYDINLCSSFCSTLFRPQFVFDFVFKYFSTLFLTLCSTKLQHTLFSAMCLTIFLPYFFDLVFSHVLTIFVINNPSVFLPWCAKGPVFTFKLKDWSAKRSVLEDRA